MKIPIHNLQGHGIHVEPMDYPNPYNFREFHRHAYFEILLFQQGGGSQIIDFKSVPLNANSVHIVFPEQVHLMKRHPEANGLVIQFLPFFTFNIDILRPPFQSEIKLKQNFDLVFQKALDLQSALKQNGSNNHEIVQLYLQIFLLSLSENAQQKHSVKDEVFQEFMLQLDLNYKAHKTVEKYASLLNLSSKTLTNLCKKHLGKSCLQVIHNRVLLEIKRMMVFEKTTIKEIAYELGFDNLATFSAFVKKKTKQNPTELRAQLSEMIN